MHLPSMVGHDDTEMYERAVGLQQTGLRAERNE